MIDGPIQPKPKASRPATERPEDAVIRTVAMPADTNPNGDIFGGWLMAQMDLAASNAAARYSQGRVVTVAADAMAFLSPVYVGDEVSVYASVVSTGRTSMRLEVQAWRRARHSDLAFKVTEGAFTFVAIGDDRRPRALPAAPAADVIAV